MTPTLVLFIALVFVAVFLLVQGMAVPTFGEGAQTRKLLRKRLADIEREDGGGSFVSLLRKDYLDGLSPFQRWIEDLPGMPLLRQAIDQAGLATPAWRVVVHMLLLALIAATIAAVAVGNVLLTVGAFALAGAVPLLHLSMVRKQRMAKFDQDLPDAIDLIKRALRAGQPFPAALKMVGEDMEGPVAKEFQATSADISYGNDPRRALLGLLSRVPSVALMGFVTAVLLQRETGGNLAEILEQISTVIRGRYRFQRRVKTLSAEGVLSARVLTGVPISLAILLTITNPTYLPILFTTEPGQRLLVAAAALMVVGIFWMRKLIRIEF
jgi:tight adherence protein B